MERTRQHILDDIASREQRVKDLKEKGDKACSKVDLMFGYDANFYLNVCPLPSNHIKWYRNELIEFDNKHKFDNVQLALF